MQTVCFAVFLYSNKFVSFLVTWPTMLLSKNRQATVLPYEKLGDINLNSFLLDVLNLLFNDFPFSRVLYP